jgi:hypothetical protein
LETKVYHWFSSSNDSDGNAGAFLFIDLDHNQKIQHTLDAQQFMLRQLAQFMESKEMKRRLSSAVRRSMIRPGMRSKSANSKRSSGIL